MAELVQAREATARGQGVPREPESDLLLAALGRLDPAIAVFDGADRLIFCSDSFVRLSGLSTARPRIGSALEQVRRLAGRSDLLGDLPLPNGGRLLTLEPAPIASSVAPAAGGPRTEAPLTAQAGADDARFRSLVETSIQGILVHRSWRLLYVNRAGAELLGFASPGDLMAQGHIGPELLPAGTFERIDQMHRQQPQGQALPSRLELDLVRRDGRSICVELCIRLTEWDGEPASFVTLVDITDRKAAEQALNDSERRFRNLVEGSLQATIIADVNWRVEFANPAAAELFGYAGVRAMLTRQDLLQRFPEEEQTRLQAFGWARLNGTPTPHRWEASAAKVDGRPIWVEATMRAIEWKDRFAIQMTAVDRTLHKAADERAAEAEQHLRLVADAMPVAMAHVDSDQRLKFVNRTAREWIGQPGEEVTGRLLPDALGGSAYGMVRPMVEAVLGGYYQQGELELPASGRSARNVAIAMVPDASRSGQVNGFFLAATDLTDRRRAEAERQKSRQLLETTFETIDQAIGIWDKDLTLVAWNRRAEELELFSRRTLRLGLPLREAYQDAVGRGIFGPGNPDAVAERRFNDVQSGRMPLFEEITLPSGVCLEAQRFYLPDGGICGVYTDVTEQKQRAHYQARLEERLAQAQKLQLISSFAGGIAHELTQPLTAICNYVRASRRLIEGIAPEPPLRVVQLMHKAVAQADRAVAIVQGLRRFIRSEHAERVSEDINALIEEVIELGVRDEPCGRLSIQLDLAEGLPRVTVDRTQIQQVILNLTTNALQALTDDRAGSVTMTTLSLDDDLILVSVRDSGPGIADSMADTLFLPFTTTKEHGMGLGLSISRSIIELHGGRLWLEPSTGPGSDFRFTLPVEPRPGS